jgi:CheY-like chemotaxis protein
MAVRKKRIVLIDDDENLLATTKAILEDEGYDVYAYNRPLGSTNRIRDAEPDLIMLDMNMPALSGETLARVLHSNIGIRDIPIVFYSSNDEDTMRKAVSEHGVRGYICKGNLYDLRSKVHVYMHKQQ